MLKNQYLVLSVFLVLSSSYFIHASHQEELSFSKLEFLEYSKKNVPQNIIAFLLESEDNIDLLLGPLFIYQTHRKFKVLIYSSIVKGVKELRITQNSITVEQSLSLIYDYIIKDSQEIKKLAKDYLTMRWFIFFEKEIMKQKIKIESLKGWQDRLAQKVPLSLGSFIDLIDNHFSTFDKLIFCDWNYDDIQSYRDLKGIKEDLQFEEQIATCLKI